MAYTDPALNFGDRYPLGGASGKRIRLGRIARPDSGRSVVATIAHGLFGGPFVQEPEGAGYGPLICAVGAAGADAIITSPGLIGHIAAAFVGKRAPGLILCLDWNNMFRDREPRLGFPEGRGSIIASVEDAVRLGADAVMTYLFVGLSDAEYEAKQVGVNGLISRECERYGMVRVIETMARGERLVGKDVYRPEYVRMHTRIASEVGADLIKTDYTGDAESFHMVVASCPVPILAAGGPLTESPRGALEIAANVVAAGGMGLVFGRNIFQASNPPRMTRALAGIVHDGWTVDRAMQELG